MAYATQKKRIQAAKLGSIANQCVLLKLDLSETQEATRPVSCRSE